MKRTLLITGFCGLLAWPLLSQVGQPENGEVVAIQQIINKYKTALPERMQAEQVPGLAIVLVNKDATLWAEGFGHLNQDKIEKVDKYTLFSLQSSSKTLTATGVLLAVQDGLVSLHTPITHYLPHFTVNSRFEKNPASKMTLAHLLGHRAGFTHETTHGNNYAPAFSSFKAHVDSIQDTWLRYPVGLHHAYANLGFDLAGRILEITSKKDFALYMRDSLLLPLGMTHSSYDWSIIKAEKNRAVGYWKLVEEMPLEHALIPSGGLYSCAVDVGAFLRFQLNDGRVNGKQLLEESLLQEMRNPSFALKGQQWGYGLGIRRYRSHGAPYFEHAGGGFGFKSHMSWYPNLGIGIAVLTNSMDQNLTHNLAYQLVNEIALSLQRPALKMHDPFAILNPGNVNQEVMKKWRGTYKGRRGKIMVEVGENHAELLMQGETYLLHFVSSNEAYMAWSSGERELFRFQWDEGRNLPLFLRRVSNGHHYDYLTDGNDLPGPNKPEWKKFEGDYQIILVDKVLETVSVACKNGYLYFGENCMQEFESGLFFSPEGEALDFRENHATWRNIRLKKLPAPEH